MGLSFLMHCLVVTVLMIILQVLLLLLTMVYNICCHVICGVHRKSSLLRILDQLSIPASLQVLNIGYKNVYLYTSTNDTLVNSDNNIHNLKKC